MGAQCCKSNENKGRKSLSRSPSATHNEDRSSTRRHSSAGVYTMPPIKQPLRIYAAMYDFTARTPEELTVARREKMALLEVASPEWCYVRTMWRGDGPTGYVPANYIVEEGAVELEPYYCGYISHQDVERALLSPGVEQGSFLIRKSSCDPLTYCLSQRVGDLVRNYRMVHTGMGYSIPYSKRAFKHSRDLVMHYAKKPEGLVLTLRLFRSPFGPESPPPPPPPLVSHYPADRYHVICTRPPTRRISFNPTPLWKRPAPTVCRKPSSSVFCTESYPAKDTKLPCPEPERSSQVCVTVKTP